MTRRYVARGVESCSRTVYLCRFIAFLVPIKSVRCRWPVNCLANCVLCTNKWDLNFGVLLLLRVAEHGVDDDNASDGIYLSSGSQTLKRIRYKIRKDAGVFQFGIEKRTV